MNIITIEITDDMLISAYGVCTIEEVRAIQREEKKHWCEHPEHEDVYYVPDNTHKDVRKHHWRCTTCKKIKQIG